MQSHQIKLIRKWLKIRFEISPESIIHQRTVYNSLDLIGDVGGLLDGLTAIGGFLITIYSFIVGDPLESYISKSVFKIDTEKIDQSNLPLKQQIQNIESRKPFIMHLFPFRRNKTQARLENLAQKRLNKLLEIDQFIKSQIQFRALVKTLLTRTEQYLLKNQRQFVLEARSDPEISDQSDRDSA